MFRYTFSRRPKFSLFDGAAEPRQFGRHFTGQSVLVSKHGSSVHDNFASVTEAPQMTKVRVQ